MWCVSFNATPMELNLWDYSVQLFHIWSPFYHLWIAFKKKSKKPQPTKWEKAPQKPPNPKQIQTPNPWVWWEGCTTQIWELDFSLDCTDTETSHLLRAWGLDWSSPFQVRLLDSAVPNPSEVLTTDNSRPHPNPPACNLTGKQIWSLAW